MMMKFTDTPYKSEEGEVRVLSLPDWSTFRPEDVIPELEVIFAEGRLLADTIARESTPSFTSLVVRFEYINDRIKKVYGTLSHLAATERKKYPELKEVEEEASLRASAYDSDIAFHEGLYRTHITFRETKEYNNLSNEQKRVIDVAIENFELAGVQLPADKKAHLKELDKKATALANSFNNNTLGAQDAWEKIITDEAILAGVPESSRDAFREDAKEKGALGWRITLRQPTVIAVMTFADNRSLREEVYYANMTKASEIGPHAGKWDNAPVIEGIRHVAHEYAQTLGFANAAEHSLAKKMAKRVGVSGVRDFLEGIAVPARKKAEGEWQALTQFAVSELGITTVEAWDIAYVWEKMLQKNHGVDQEVLRQYFPFTKVAEGFAMLVERLYGMKIIERGDVSVWNSDVHFFEVYDEEGVLRGTFYADLFAREGKRSGAWMDELTAQFHREQGVQIPVAYLNCNFLKPKEGEAYLDHREIETYFHEAGHVLHHILGKTTYYDLAMMFVEWDTVELPSQLMESWTYEPDMLRAMSAHKVSKEIIPDELISKLIAAKYFNCGLTVLRQLMFGIYDFELYATYDPLHPVDANAYWREVHQRLDVRPLPEYVRFPNSFGHIFGGGYGAGYFSYMWADGLVADVFASYKESGDMFSREVGKRFLHEVLEVGSARPMADSFRTFRGRDLDPKKLVAHLGLAE